MLVVSRRIGEQIVLPHLDVTISVERVRGKCTVLGVSAPPHVVVRRAELKRLPPESAEIEIETETPPS